MGNGRKAFLSIHSSRLPCTVCCRPSSHWATVLSRAAKEQTGFEAEEYDDLCKEGPNIPRLVIDKTTADQLQSGPAAGWRIGGARRLLMDCARAVDALDVHGRWFLLM